MNVEQLLKTNVEVATSQMLKGGKVLHSKVRNVSLVHKFSLVRLLLESYILVGKKLGVGHKK